MTVWNVPVTVSQPVTTPASFSLSLWNESRRGELWAYKSGKCPQELVLRGDTRTTGPRPMVSRDWRSGKLTPGPFSLKGKGH
jgi:hypothetical protein